jgi:hypothetical protein
LIDADFVRAHSALAQWQGRYGLHFAGSYCHDVDGQDTALMSAVNVARDLAPESARLKQLMG